MLNDQTNRQSTKTVPMPPVKPEPVPEQKHDDVPINYLVTYSKDDEFPDLSPQEAEDNSVGLTINMAPEVPPLWERILGMFSKKKKKKKHGKLAPPKNLDPDAEEKAKEEEEKNRKPKEPSNIPLFLAILALVGLVVIYFLSRN